MTYITPEAAREQDDALREAENRVEELESQLAIEQSYIGNLAEEMAQLDKELSTLRQAVELATTAVPTMTMDADNPIRMMHRVVAETETLREQLRKAIAQNYCTFCGRILATIPEEKTP